MWSGAARSTPINDKTDRKKPSAWRKGNRKTRRSVNAVSIAQSENVFGAPGRPDGDRRHASVASAESHSVTSPRWTKACSYADQFPTRYFVLYFGWTFDLMSRSCTRSGHRGQRADSCLVAAEGLCTNAAIERDEIVCPRIDAFYTEHLYCGEDDLFGSGHPPDTVVAMALAYHAFKTGRQPGDYGITI